MSLVVSTFRPDAPSLQQLLKDIEEGSVQLPDFQRGWVWDDQHIRALIASVSLSYPIGAVMLLEATGNGFRFKPRPVEGVVTNREPSKLILDGQQRLTSLYLSLISKSPVNTRTEKGVDIQRVYYLDMQKCLNPEVDRADAVLGLSPDRVVRSDFGRQVDLDVSTREKEYERMLFPLNLVCDDQGLMAWRQGFYRHHHFDVRHIELYDEFESTVVQRFKHYRIPVIELLASTPKEAVCQVFENVNTGGVALTVFELVTASFAAEEFHLRDDWKARAERIHSKAQLRKFDATDFLTSVTLLATYKRNLAEQGTVSCKRRDILRLTLEEYRSSADAIEAGLIRAARFLTREKVFDARNLPYGTQLIPLSAICAVLGDRFENDAVRKKLARWFWCGVFGELYGGANETRYALDLPEVVKWIDGGPEPTTVRDANFAPTRLLTLQTRNSAAYKGVMALLMQLGSEDFLSGDKIELTQYFDGAVDIHHIFPQSYCMRQDYSDKLWNSVVNKSPLTARTNRIIGGSAPSIYLSSLERNHNVPQGRQDEILFSHAIDASLLRADDFHGFIRHRASRLLDLIEEATGKTISGRNSEEVVHAFGGPLGLEKNGGVSKADDSPNLLVA